MDFISRIEFYKTEDGIEVSCVKTIDINNTHQGEDYFESLTMDLGKEMVEECCEEVGFSIKDMSFDHMYSLLVFVNVIEEKCSYEYNDYSTYFEYENVRVNKWYEIPPIDQINEW